MRTVSAMRQSLENLATKIWQLTLGRLATLLEADSEHGLPASKSSTVALNSAQTNCPKLPRHHS